MRIPVRLSPLLMLGALNASCNNEHDLRQHIQQNQTLLLKKQNELSDLNYKVTRNSLRVGTSDYDSTIGKDFSTRSASIQVSIDSLKAQTDSLESLLPK